MGWKQSSDDLKTAEDAYLKACRTHGEDSPEARAADDAAFAAADRHFGTHGNPNDRHRAR